MANQLYTSIKEDFLGGSINLSAVNLRVALVTSGYSLDIDNHRYLSDINPLNIAASSNILENVTITDGVLDAENETIEDYGTSGFSYLIIYESTGSSSTSRLIAYIDTADGLPVQGTSSPVSITIRWSDLITKIFSL
jgi:hypothetical protein